MFFLVNFIIVFVLQIIASKAHFVAILAAIYVIAVFLPSLAVAIRRLHDTDRSGWWVLISLVPLIGGIWLLILMVLDGTPGGNRFGPDPKQSPL